MSRDRPKLTARAEAELAARRAREAEALRANLRRRKAQQRAKTEPDDDAVPSPAERTKAD